MDTKLKGWKAVRITSFILILVLSFIILNRLLETSLRVDETGISADIVLTDLSTNEYFARQFLNRAFYHAEVVAYFGSKEAIEAKQHIKWFKHGRLEEQYINEEYYEEFSDIDNQLRDDNTDWQPDDVYPNNPGLIYKQWFELWTPNREYWYMTLTDNAFNIENVRMSYEADAIEEQLSLFQ
ncbi:MAG: hypothetical protein LBD23_19400, partial [Oscillospiraceae bacterium]|nr:hypothetical protein [Oscillospiraceae bacterium]